MLDLTNLVAGLNVLNLFRSPASSCSCLQEILISGLLSFWGGLLVGILGTLLAVSPSLRRGLTRAFRAFFDTQPEPHGPANRQQNWRGGVQLTRYRLD